MNLKPRPFPTQDPRTGMFQYIKASPYLHHISAPRLYALRHKRRLYFSRPGPSLLRNVVTASLDGKLFWSTVPVCVNPNLPTLPLGALELKTHQRTVDPFERPLTTTASAPRPHTRQEQRIEIPACLDCDLDGPNRNIWSTSVSGEQLYHTAETIVGAHPDSLPVPKRTIPTTPVHVSFPWASSAGNFKFGLVQAQGHGGPVKPKFVQLQYNAGNKVVATLESKVLAFPKTPRVRPLSESRNENAYTGVKKLRLLSQAVGASGHGKLKVKVNAPSAKDSGKNKENVAVAAAVCV